MLGQQRSIDLDYTPLPVFVPFHASTAQYRCLIGGLGSGKTAAMNYEILRLLLSYPGLDAIVLRRIIPELKDSTEAAFFEALPAELKSACKVQRIQGHYDSIKFPNGSSLKFRGAEDPDRFKSAEFGLITFDEVDQIPESDVKRILQRLRQSRPLGGGKLPAGRRMFNGALFACNPAGKNWVWSAFVNPPTRWPESSVHLSTALDNPFLPADYVDRLLTFPLAVIRRTVYCEFDAAGGQIYTPWAWDTHVVAPREPGHYGQRTWMAFDPGMLAPTAGLWVEIDDATGRMTAVAEYQEGGLAAPVHAANWRKIEAARKPQKTVRRIGDPSMTKRDPGSGEALSDVYRRLGFSFEPGPVRQGIRIPHLQNAIRLGEFNCTEACPRLYEQISMARWEDQVPRLRDLGEYREKKAASEDHIHDCAQYLASMRRTAGKALAPQPQAASYWDEEIARERALALRRQGEIEAAWHAERCANVKRQVAGRAATARRRADGVLS